MFTRDATASAISTSVEVNANFGRTREGAASLARLNAFRRIATLRGSP